MFRNVLKSQVYLDLVSKHTSLMESLISTKTFDYRANPEFVQMFDQCIELMDQLGLHYGHFVKSRKCDKSYINKTRYSVNLIDLKKSYENLLKSHILLYQQLLNNKNILFVSKRSYSFLEDNKIPNICSIKKWIGGTITNSKHVLPSYKCKTYDNAYGYMSLIYLLDANSAGILSKEVISYNRISDNKITLHMLTDTNVQFNIAYEVIPILLNDESPYFKSFVGAAIELLINIYIKNKPKDSKPKEVKPKDSKPREQKHHESRPRDFKNDSRQRDFKNRGFRSNYSPNRSPNHSSHSSPNNTK